MRATQKCPFMPPIRRVERLTTGSTSSSVWGSLDTTGYRANCVECANTPHSSDPTLRPPVHGLRRIIHDRWTCVLRGQSSPTDFNVGLGCFVFRVRRRTC